MKNLVLTAAVLGAASLATACGGSTSPEGTAAVSWTLQDWDDTGKTAIAATCPAGADTAIVYELPTSETDASLATKDLFNCADMDGTTAPLIADDYQFWVDITDHSGATLFAESNTKVQSIINNTDPGVSFTFQVNRGYITAAWTLEGATTHGTLSCGQASAGGVEFDSMIGAGIPISDQFTCSDGMGTTFPLPIADYTFSAQAIDSSNPPQGIGAATVGGDANIQTGNQVINKGSLVLQVDGL